jgi:phosphoesterase RecJ-like protein
VPKQLQFLPGSSLVTDDIDKSIYDLLIISGCSNLKRIGNEKIENLETKILNIDHHKDNTNYGHINIVDQNKSSVAELAYDLFTANKWTINSEIATCLLTGIFTDTGSFMHSNTQSSTLKTAGELMSKGALIHTVAKNTFQGKDLKALHAWGKALDNAFFDKNNKIIYSIITEGDLVELGNIPPSTFEGLVETLNKVPEAKFAMFLKQDGENVKGSLRSETYKGVNVNLIAKMFGGGGHTLASGFSLIGKLIKDDAGKWQVE